MKDNYFHICIASEKEVMFRVDSDYKRAFNCLALAIHDTKSVLLADAIMSNHIHFCVQTSDPELIVRKFRISYQKYFNHRYDRHGLLGDVGYSQVLLISPLHCMVAATYVLRNPLHHGVTMTPFEYPHSSVKSYFRNSLGNVLPPEIPKISHRRANLPRNRQLPPGYLLDADGQIVRDSVIDVHHMEHLFVTPQDFMINMVRYSTKKWRDSLATDVNDPNLISLDSVESSRFLLSILEKNEHGKCAKTQFGDIFLCEQIDNVILPQLGISSVYELNLQQQIEIGRLLSVKYKSSLNQLARCLAVTDDSFFRLFYRK